MSKYSFNNNFTFRLCLLAVLLALYLVFSFSVLIPIVSHISFDLGYVIFAFSLFLFGWKAFSIGACGCILSSLLISGWFPLGWFLGQIFIGLFCGFFYKFFDKHLSKPALKHLFNISSTLFAVFIGIVIIKTVIECLLFNIPWLVKFTTNSIAFFVDSFCMVCGYFIAYGLKPLFEKRGFKF